MDPLTPPDCDCRGLPFMPLEVNRLTDSELVALSTGDEFKAAFLLWVKSWVQVPAASIPDDDRLLARWTGYSLSEWLGLRDMALRNWIKCSDGRLYHPVVADLAISAFDKRKGQAERANSRWAKAKAAQKASGQPTHDEPDATASPDDATVMQVKVKEEGEEPPRSPPLGGDADDGFEEALGAYPKAGQANTSRPKAKPEWLKACAAETRTRMLATVRAYTASAFAQMEGGRRVPTFQKWLREGMYRTFLSDAVTEIQWTGPPELRAAIVLVKGEDFCRAWLDPAGWRNGPERTILARTGIAADRLRDRELAPILMQHDARVRHEKSTGQEVTA